MRAAFGGHKRRSRAMMMTRGSASQTPGTVQAPGTVQVLAYSCASSSLHPPRTAATPAPQNGKTMMRISGITSGIARGLRGQRPRPIIMGHVRGLSCAA